MDGKNYGKVHVYTGHGKGKTTASVGLMVRALGHDARVYFCQFLKMGYTGEAISLRRHFPKAKLEFFGPRCVNWEQHEKDIHAGTFEGFCRQCFDLTEKDEPLAQKGYEKLYKAAASGDYDLVIADEINVALHKKLLKKEQVLKLIKDKAKHTELVLTGRNADPEVMAKADLITEMRPLKHYFTRGFMAREGIEF